jgi:hypothetical protein
MKACIWLVITLGLIVAAGCKKESSPDTAGAATVSTAPLDSSFQSADPAVQANVSAVKNDVRYGTYDKALADLQKLAALPNLTPGQDKAI